MYPIYSPYNQTEDHTTNRGLHFVLQDQMNVWTIRDGIYETHNGGELTLYNHDTPIALTRMTGAGPVETSATLMLHAQRIHPWVESMSKMHQVFAAYEQEIQINDALQNFPEHFQQPEELRNWLWTILDHAEEPEIIEAQDLAINHLTNNTTPPNYVTAPQYQIISWIAQKLDNLPPHLWQDTKNTIKTVGTHTANTIKTRLTNRLTHLRTHEKIIIPSYNKLPDIDLSWRIIYHWGRSYSEKYSWSATMADVLLTDWRMHATKRDLDTAVTWALRHNITRDHISHLTELPRHVIDTIADNPKPHTPTTIETT